MDIYITTLLVGAAGLCLMALGGLAARGGGHGAVSHGPAHPGGHAGAPGHVHGGGHVGPSSGHAHGGGHLGGHRQGLQHHALSSGTSVRGLAARGFFTITSPRFLFSAFLGFGTAGELLRPVLGGPLLVVGALAGALAFERFVVSPIWDFAMRFASAPAATLESAISDEATAVTSFDANGQGIVSLELDGQVVQILATLQSGDRGLGVHVRAGQRVRIEDVNAATNRCTVSLL